MAELAASMPEVTISQTELQRWGQAWLNDVNHETGNAKNPHAFDRQQSVNFATFIDQAFASSLATMLGDIPVLTCTSRQLLPLEPDCVETGMVRIIGGVRPQNFDAAYRPDGPRVVFDSKTLNDSASIRKNWQNMINDLSTEAATVHTRFPYALVVFMVVIPAPAIAPTQEADIIRTLERLGNRRDVLDQDHLAEAISLLFWDPGTGTVLNNRPAPESDLRVERLSERIYPHYANRYKGLPPHNV
jgi:hypothetical protein